MFSMLIDTHCHLDFPDFEPDLDAVLKNAENAGVKTVINVGSSLKGSERSVELADKYPCIYASVGIHPHDAKDCDEAAFERIRKLAVHQRTVAIGEVGLDYYRNLSLPEVQKKVFARFIELAVEKNRPLVIHCRQAEEDVLSILKEHEVARLKGVVFHCFSGDEGFLRDCLDLGFFVSFTCNVTYPKARNLKEIVRLAPLDRMFLETDTPFLSPEGQRGKRNEPSNVVALAHEVSFLKNIDFQKVCAQTTQNAKSFFGL